MSAPSRAETLTASPSLTTAFKNPLSQRILQVLLDRPLQRPGAEGRIVTLVGQPLTRGLIESHRDLARRQQSSSRRAI